MNKKHMHGLIPEPTLVRDFDYEACCVSDTPIDLPRRFELPINEWSTVRKQYVNGCVGYAMSSAKEAHHYKTTGERKLWSPGYIYGNAECRPTWNGEGMFLSDAMKGALTVGFVPETVFDIIVEMPEMKTIMDERPDLRPIGEEKKLAGFVRISYGLKEKHIRAIKEALYIYRIPLIVASNEFFGGGHCFLLYGWDDDIPIKKRYPQDDVAFLLRNSWGEEYGDGGNSNIPVSEVEQIYLPFFEEIPFKFKDVTENDWFFSDVKKAVFAGYFKGVSDTEFNPNGNFIRGDVALAGFRLLTKLVTSINAFSRTLNQLGVDTYQVEIRDIVEAYPFKDIPTDAYYYDAIGGMYANDILNGITDTTFEPERPISRAEFAAIMVRIYLHILDLIKTAVPKSGIIPIYSVSKKYTDITSTDWYCDYVEKATQLGLMGGDGDGSFRPNDNVSRAEACAVWNRLTKLVDTDLTKIRSAVWVL